MNLSLIDHSLRCGSGSFFFTCYGRYWIDSLLGGERGEGKKEEPKEKRLEREREEKDGGNERNK
jgi:hypothetical protein